MARPGSNPVHYSLTDRFYLTLSIQVVQISWCLLKDISDLDESCILKTTCSPTHKITKVMYISTSGWHPCGYYLLVLNKWSYRKLLLIKMLKHGIDQLLSLLCFRCVQCFWILKSSLAQWLKGLFTMLSMFLTISSVDWLHWEVSSECRKTKAFSLANHKGHSQTILRTNENSKKMHVVDVKCGKAWETKLWLVLV